MNPSARQCVPSLLLVLALSACTGATVPVDPATPLPAPATAPRAAAGPAGPVPAPGPSVAKRGAGTSADGSTDFEVELRRSGCFGRCPAYRVQVRGDGTVTFTGERDVGSPGEHRDRIPAANVAAFRDELARPPYATLKGRYTPDDPRCGLAATDMASVTLLIRDAGSTRQIEHYLGCSDAPASLHALAKAIDDLSGSARWIGAPVQ